MVVRMIVIFGVIVPAPAGLAMRVGMGIARGADIDHVARGRFGMVSVSMMLMPVMMVMGVLMFVTVIVGVAVIMIVVMIVPAAAGFAVSVLVMGVVVVSMVVVTMGLRGLIGAAFRLERHFDDGNGRAQSDRHLLQNRVAGDADAVGKQFGGHVAVAEMPGQASEMVRIACHDLRHRLFGRDDGDDTPVVELQAVAILQMRRLRQVEEESDVPLPSHGDAAAVPAVMGQHHAVGGARGIPGAG